MIRASIDPDELSKAFNALQSLSDATGEGIEDMLLREGASMEKEIKQSLNIGGRLSGRGPRGGKLVIHSAPGEPPYKQTGRLQNSIGYSAFIKEQAGKIKEYFLDIGAIRKVSAGEVKYAGDLELGTSRVAPRPYLTPVVMEHVQSWGEKLKRIFG